MLALGRPTLQCSCNGAFCERAVEYHQAPEGETPFPMAGGAYYRAYDACRLCGHFFAAGGLDARALYTGGYVDATYGSPEQMREKFRAIVGYPPERSDNYWRVKRVDEYWRRRSGRDTDVRPRLLDVGAGLAVFPFGMRSVGWDCTAVDPDPRAVQHAREECGLSAVCGDVFDLTAGTLGEYDAITLNKVLEHVGDPVRLLAKAAAHLRQGGFVYVEVPDAAARDDGLRFGREEFFIEHLHVFSPASLCHLVGASGLRLNELRRLREPSGKYTLVAFASSR